MGTAEHLREKDSCGVGFVADVSGRRSRRILDYGLEAIVRLTHRGAVDADARTGDGAGILTQIPHKIFARELKRMGREEGPGDYAVGVLFMPRQDQILKERCAVIIEETLSHYDLPLLGLRPVPVDTSHLGDRAAESRPDIQHLVVGRPAGMPPEEFERTLYLARKEMELHVSRKGIEDFYIPSFSSRTIVYKGMFVAPQLQAFYRDLQDQSFETAIVLFHQRYSTNTFPNWNLAQPFRLLAHNGEINTLDGNRNWVRSKEGYLSSPVFKERVKKLIPVIQENGSDSQSLDNVMELLWMGGRDILHVAAMLIPQAWQNMPDMDPDLRAFYEYHDTFCEPWDGPAALAFTDGEVVAACLDRNGLRPSRYLVLDDGVVILGSEVGLVTTYDVKIVEKGRLGPGQMIAVDTRQGRLLKDSEIKAALAGRKPYRLWLQEHMRVCPPHLRSDLAGIRLDEDELLRLEKAFFYTQEDLRMIVRTMAETGKEPTFSMGDDTPLSMMSDHPRLLYTYFKQKFAQVTNPAIDPLREEIVMSLHTTVGQRGSFLEEKPEHAHKITFDSPLITPKQLDYLKTLDDPAFRHAVLRCVFGTDKGEAGLRAQVEQLAKEAVQLASGGARVLILSDRDTDNHHVPVPMLLCVGAVHHALIRAGLRDKVALVCETAEPRETHHFACLIGYGATLVCPYLALAVAMAMCEGGELNGLEPEKGVANYLKAADTGILKIMSKMGISAVSSYRAAQIFEAVGLNPEVIDFCFEGTPCRLPGAGYEEIARDVLRTHRSAFDPEKKIVDVGYYKFRKWGEYHASYPPAIKLLQKALREGSMETYQQYADMVNHRPPTAVRDLLDIQETTPVPLDEVEPVESIIRRFNTAAMSFGALSKEAHETLAIAMNRLGGKSNSGEGGEDPDRFFRWPGGDWANSAIKQVASGRFGVTPAYLAAAKELEIKIAQGAKPGEGGQLPGHKVTATIAKVRQAVPGVSLISPPPHHDIYSIEDIAQLIYDLKQANPRAKVCVKLVSCAGVGTIAAGVAKAYADVIHISGHDGGTGASPASSIKHAGVPWELGLVETQHVLVHNDLRGRVVLRTDGGLRTGRDVVIAALLGAEEFAFGTIALIAVGCVMARQCHENTCPVGVATQDPKYRAKFKGSVEMVCRYFRFVAQETRQILSRIGARTLDEIIGRVDLLAPREVDLPKANRLDVGFVLSDPDPTGQRPRRHTKERNDRVDTPLDDAILQDAREAITRGLPLTLDYRVANQDRAVGTKVSGEIAFIHGARGIQGPLTLRLKGTAGQSFGAFLAPGVCLHLEGDANDYVGKGMAGGEIVLRPPAACRFSSHENVIMGNTCLYGATGGKLFAAGRAGERFAVRNSGAVAVVEGVGDHGCEYMTGGVVVVLGEVGRNFAAGMTGGLAYVLDEKNLLERRYNRQIVGLRRVEEAEDVARLKELIQAHADKTGSRWSRKILGNFDVFLPKFWKVVPPPPAVQTEETPEAATAAK